MRLLTILTLLTICLTAIGQAPTKKLTSYQHGNIDTEIEYTDSTGNSIIIQNSGPRGGRGFTDAIGNRFGYRIFWTRIINEAGSPLTLTITFPADSFSLPSPDSYMKVFLHPDTMTPDGETTFDDGRKQFADTTLLKSFCHTRTNVKKILNPNESCLLYTVVLRHHQGSSNSPRAGFVLKQHDLFYRIIPEFNNELIPCGQIVFENLR